MNDRIAYLRQVDSPTLSNAIEELNIRPRSDGFASLNTRALFPEMGTMCGYAVTAQVETVTRQTEIDKDVFCDLFAAVHASLKPAVVVMQEIGGRGEFAAHCGEVMSTIFKRLGAIGVVSDCGVRDIPEVRAMEMHYFAKGAAASHAYFHIVRVNVPVEIDGLAVRPGDVLHGDENGLLAVPECSIDELRKAVENVRSRELRLMDFVRGPEFSLDGLRDRFLE